MMQGQGRLIALIVLAVLATALLLRVPQQSVDDEPQRVFPGLVPDQVTTVILASDGQTFTMTRGGSGWQLEEQFGYPVDFGSLSGLLVSLSELAIAETKTAKPEHHARLGVAESGEGVGTVITLLPGGEKLILGARSASRGSFLRYVDDARVYLSDEPLEVAMEVLSWLDPVIIDVEAESVREVSIATARSEFLSAQWDDESGGLVLDNIPAGRELRYEGITDSLGRLLVNLRFLAVAPYRDDIFTDPRVSRVTLDDGEVIEWQTVQSGEDYWLHVSREPVSEWQYRVSQFTFRELNKTVEDMLKQPETDEVPQEVP